MVKEEEKGKRKHNQQIKPTAVVGRYIRNFGLYFSKKM